MSRPSTVHHYQTLFRAWEVELLTFETDTEPYAIKRDAKIRRLAEESEVSVETSKLRVQEEEGFVDFQVKVVERVSHTLWDVEQLLAANRGKSPGNYTGFQVSSSST